MEKIDDRMEGEGMSGDSIHHQPLILEGSGRMLRKALNFTSRE